VSRRGEVLQIAGATVINDCYNSNPRALDSMVDALAAMAPGPGGRRIVVAGEMLELGPAGEDLHRRCGQHMVQHGIDVIIGVRGCARAFAEGVRLEKIERPGTKVRTEFLETPEQAADWLRAEVRRGDVVLLKASRGVHLERALEQWRAHAGQ
jgi:UDP-N-acetylmuramoyl-tripeptide--D-alanyl-D-alanine ligase